MNRLMTVFCAVFLLQTCVIPGFARAGGCVPVGTYLYAKPENPKQFTGRLTVHFTTSGKRMVVGYGRKYRKDRKSRKGTT